MAPPGRRPKFPEMLERAKEMKRRKQQHKANIKKLCLALHVLPINHQIVTTQYTIIKRVSARKNFIYEIYIRGVCLDKLFYTLTPQTASKWVIDRGSKYEPWSSPF